MTPEEKDQGKPGGLPKTHAFDGRNLKTPTKRDVNAGRVPKAPPKPTGSAGKGK